MIICMGLFALELFQLVADEQQLAIPCDRKSSLYIECCMFLLFVIHLKKRNLQMGVSAKFPQLSVHFSLPSSCLVDVICSPLHGDGPL